MRCIALLLLSAVLMTGFGELSHAAVSQPAAQIRALTALETQRAALEHLRDTADPAWRPLLQALQEGALYIWRDRVLIFTAAGVLVDLEGHELLDANGEPWLPDDGLEPVALAEDNIPLVQQMLDALNLFTADPAIRKSTALRLGNLRDGSLAPLLGRAMRRETDAEVRAVLEEAVHKLRLFDAEAQVRLQAVAFFRAARSEAAVSHLVALQQQETEPQVRAAIARTLRDIERFLQFRKAVGYLFNGLSLASVLLLMSLGLAITFGLMGIINMAHGEMLMLGSYTAYVLQEAFASYAPGYVDYSFVVALPLSVVLVGCVGLLLERGVLRFLYGRPLESLLLTWGIGMILQQSARLYFGDQTSVSPPTWFRDGWEIMPGLILPYSRLFIMLVAMFSLIVVYLALFRSRMGLTIRAVMQNRDMAACMGVSARTVDALTFAAGAALAGLAGCALSLIGTVDPEVGKTYIVDSFLVVVLGGVGKLVGTVLAALGIGVANKTLEPALGGTAAAVYAKVGILLLVILFLQLKPTGLFPAKERTAAGALR